MGRPRQWASSAEKLREFRKRRAVRDKLVTRLLLAVRNANVGGSELHRAAQFEDDEGLLRALAVHYEGLNWNRRT